MRELGILIKFEYIKLFKKRSTWIILLLLLAAGIFGSVEMLIGNDINNGRTGTNYENMIKYKKNALALSGRKINTELIKKPSLCMTCINDNNPKEDMECKMTRYD